MSNTFERLTSILQDCFDDDTVIAKPDLTAADVSGWDSLAHVRLMLMIERAFKIRFTAAEISSFENVDQLVTAIDLKTGNA